MLTRNMIWAIVAVVTVVWAANIIAGIVNPLHYKASEAVNGIFMAVVGSLVAIAVRGGSGKDGDDGRG